MREKPQLLQISRVSLSRIDLSVLQAKKIPNQIFSLGHWNLPQGNHELRTSFAVPQR
jgi:hypothetical protein